MDGSNLQSLDGTRIGRVIAVSAAQVIGLLENQTADASRQAEPIEMGAMLKLQTRASTVYGMVTALRVPLPSLSAPDEDLKIVERELGIDYAMAEHGHYQNVCPSCRRKNLAVTQDRLWSRGA